MANYNNTSGGSAGTIKRRFQWGSAVGGAAATTEERSKPEFLRKTEVRRPVIADADRRGISGVVAYPQENHHNNQGNVKENEVGYNKSEGLKREETPPKAPEPTMISPGGRARRFAWTEPPEAPLAKATNDRGTAANNSRESARPQVAASLVPDRRSPQPKPTYDGNNGRSHTGTIDSNEVAEKYGGVFINAEKKVRPAAKTINSNEAAEKYDGQLIKK